MSIVFPSVREGMIAILSGAVDPVPAVTARHQAGCPTTDTHHADSSGGVSSLGLSQENKWNVIVRLAGIDDIGSKEVDISSFTVEDTRRLKTEDPFLYRSIPSVRCRSYLCDGIDYGDNMRMAKSSSSCDPSLSTDFIGKATTHQLQQENFLFQNVHADTRRPEIIVRRNRLSTEAHPSLLLDQWMLRELEELDSRPEIIVRRNRRVSTEVHPSLLLDQLMLLKLEELDADATDQEIDCMHDDLKQLFYDLP
jgi:hypothetical protein